MYGYLLSIIISVICNQLGVFGKTDNFICFVKKDYLEVGLIIFYLPLVLVIGFNIFAFYKLLKYLGDLFLESKYETINLLKYYPLVLAICYTTGIFYRSLSLIESIKNSLGYLEIFHAFFSSLSGFLNFIIYIKHKLVKE